MRSPLAPWCVPLLAVLAALSSARALAQSTSAPTVSAAGGAATSATAARLPSPCISTADIVTIDWRNEPTAVAGAGVPTQPIMEAYTVPAGRTLVLTDFRLTPAPYPACWKIVEIEGPSVRIKLDQGDYYFGPFPVGLAFAPGSKVALVVDTSCGATPMFVRYTLQGYLIGPGTKPGCLSAANIVNVGWRASPAATPVGVLIPVGGYAEAWSVPASKRLVVQQFLSYTATTEGWHVAQLSGSQLTFKHDSALGSGGPSWINYPLGLVFEPGSKVMLASSGPLPAVVRYDLIGYLEDV